MINALQRFINFLTSPIVNYKMKLREKKVDALYRDVISNIVSSTKLDSLKTIKGYPQNDTNREFLLSCLNKIHTDKKLNPETIPDSIRQEHLKLKAEKLIRDFQSFKGNKSEFWKTTEKKNFMSFADFLNALNIAKQATTSTIKEMIDLGVSYDREVSLFTRAGGEKGLAYLLKNHKSLLKESDWKAFSERPGYIKLLQIIHAENISQLIIPNEFKKEQTFKLFENWMSSNDPKTFLTDNKLDLKTVLDCAGEIVWAVSDSHRSALILLSISSTLSKDTQEKLINFFETEYHYDFTTALNELAGEEVLNGPNTSAANLKTLFEVIPKLPEDLKNHFINKLTLLFSENKTRSELGVKLLQALNEAQDSSLVELRNLILKNCIKDELKNHPDIDKKTLLKNLNISDIRLDLLEEITPSIEETRFFKQVEALEYFITEEFSSEAFSTHAHSLSDSPEKLIVIVDIYQELPQDKRKAFVEKCIEFKIFTSLEEMFQQFVSTQNIETLSNKIPLIEELTGKKLIALLPQNHSYRKTLLAIEAFQTKKEAFQTKKALPDGLTFEKAVELTLSSKLITENEKMEIVLHLLKNKQSEIKAITSATPYILNHVIRDCITNNKTKAYGITLQEAAKVDVLIDDENGALSKEIINKASQNQALEPLLTKAISAFIVNKNTTRNEIINIYKTLPFMNILKAFNLAKQSKTEILNPYFNELYHHFTFRTNSLAWPKEAFIGWGGNKDPQEELLQKRNKGDSDIEINHLGVPHQILADFKRETFIDGKRLQEQIDPSIEIENPKEGEPETRTVFKKLMDCMNSSTCSLSQKENAAHVAMISMIQTFDAAPLTPLINAVLKNQHLTQGQIKKSIEFRLNNESLIVKVIIEWNIIGDFVLTLFPIEQNDCVLNQITSTRSLSIDIGTGKATSLGETFSTMDEISPETIFNLAAVTPDNEDFFKLCEETYGLNKEAIFRLVTSRNTTIFESTESNQRKNAVDFFIKKLTPEDLNRFKEVCQNGKNENLKAHLEKEKFLD